MDIQQLQQGAILAIDKPYKWTSFDVVNYIRKSIGVKVGHAGTLDPLATGLLILCTGPFTKKIDSFKDLQKEYTGTITLGATTPSFDMETEVNEVFSIAHLNNELILNAAKELEGTYHQTAPLYSAKWIDGERAYYKARRGENVEVKSHEVTIESFEITDISLPYIKFKVICSKGSYIRSLARDIGMKLECGAYLSELRRTRIGDYKVDDAITIEKFRELFPIPDNFKSKRRKEEQ